MTPNASAGLRSTRLAILVSAALVLASCSSLRETFDPTNIEYRNVTRGPVLDLPPDLIGAAERDRDQNQRSGGDGTTLSQFNRNREQAAGAQAGADPRVVLQPGTTETGAARSSSSAGAVSAGGPGAAPAEQSAPAGACTGASARGQANGTPPSQGPGPRTPPPAGNAAGVPILPPPGQDDPSMNAGPGAVPSLSTMPPPATERVLPTAAGTRLETFGGRTYLIVNQTPEQAWSVLREFWNRQGFNLKMDDPALGIMETDWAERHERIETGGIRGALSRGLGTSYSNGDRDRYRTQIDRLASGATQISIFHAAMTEEVNSLQRDRTIWQHTEPKPQFEVEYLRRLAERFGMSTAQARDMKVQRADAPPTEAASASNSAYSGDAQPASTSANARGQGQAQVQGQGAGVPAAGAAAAVPGAAATAAATTAAAASSDGTQLAAARKTTSAIPGARDERSQVVEQDGLSTLRVHEDFDRAWRDVGIVLDRTGFTVEDRDRSRGLYYVRYVDLDRRDPNQGALSRMFTGPKPDLRGQRYQLRLSRDAAATASGAANTSVAVLNANGAEPRSEEDRRIANRIVTLLHEHLAR